MCVGLLPAIWMINVGLSMINAGLLPATLLQRSCNSCNMRCAGRVQCWWNHQISVICSVLFFRCLSLLSDYLDDDLRYRSPSQRKEKYFFLFSEERIYFSCLVAYLRQVSHWILAFRWNEHLFHDVISLGKLISSRVRHMKHKFDYVCEHTSGKGAVYEVYMKWV